MRSEVKLTVTEKDTHVWMILDDTGVLFEGKGPEMVQAFTFMTGTSQYPPTKKLEKRFGDVTWTGTLRLVRQKSCFCKGKPKTSKKKKKQRAGKSSRRKKSKERLAKLLEEGPETLFE